MFFEAPATEGDNVYDVLLTVSDGSLAISEVVNVDSFRCGYEWWSIEDNRRSRTRGNDNGKFDR